MSGLCVQCMTLGYCRRLQSRVVSDAELGNTAFIRDLRAYAFGMKVSRDRWVEVLANIYRDYPGRIVDEAGAEVMLDLEVFDFPGIRDWLRDFACTPCPAGVAPRVRIEAWERVRVMASILRAHAPEKASQWGVVPANDHTPVCRAETTSSPLSHRNPPRGCPARLGRHDLD